MTITELIAALALVLPFLVSLATFLYRLAEAHLPHNKATLLTTVAQTAVQAAEQCSVSSSEKKRMATEIVQAGLSSLGIKVDPRLVDASIESLVYAMRGTAASAITQPQPAVSATVVPPPVLPS